MSYVKFFLYFRSTVLASQIVDSEGPTPPANETLSPNTNNYIGLHIEMYQHWANKPTKTCVSFLLRNYTSLVTLKECNDDIFAEDWDSVLKMKFPSLGDFSDDQIENILGNPDLSKVRQENDIYGNNAFLFDEPCEDNNEEEEGVEEVEAEEPKEDVSKKITRSKKNKQPVRLTELCEKIVIKSEKNLNEKIFKLELKRALSNFELASNVDNHLELPIKEFRSKRFPIFGLSTIMNGHLLCPSVDLTHSATRNRAAQLSGDILGGYKECFVFVAYSGLTQLTVTDCKDRVDMQDDSKARILFSRDVEAALRLFSKLYEDDVEVSYKFKKSADVCRFFRLYITSLSNTSIDSETRLACIGYLLITIRHKYNIFNFPKGIAKICGIPNHTFQGIIVNLWSFLIMSQTISSPLHPRCCITSQTCEHLFSTAQRLSASPTGAILATSIDTIMSRSIYLRLTQMKIDKKFSYMSSKRPIYEENIIEDSEVSYAHISLKTRIEEFIIPKNHATVITKFNSQFDFPIRRTNSIGYAITNMATVRDYNKERPIEQYAAIANMSCDEIIRTYSQAPAPGGRGSAQGSRDQSTDSLVPAPGGRCPAQGSRD